MNDSVEDTLRSWVEVFMSRSMRNFLFFAKENGLSMSQIGALRHIRLKGASGVSDVGDELGITSAAASQMLERLVQQDLVLRSEDPHDRRLKHIVLTVKGEEILRESMLARQRWLGDLVRLMDPAEQQQVLSALQILIEKANQLKDLPVEMNSSASKE